MSERDDDARVRPGRIGDRGRRKTHPSTLAGDVRRAAMKAGFLRRGPKRGGSGPRARGRRAALAARLHPRQRRVVIKARVVRHAGRAFRAAPLARHIGYLEREGVTREGHEPGLFDAGGDAADGPAFAARCEGDRHHFRFIVSPEDAAELADLRAFTRELMADMAADLETRLDWVAIDHWNTDNPHVHVLVRGVAQDGKDLVIDRDYMRAGLRARAQERATLELGPRTAHEIERVLAREVEAERWTSLDGALTRLARDADGLIDLRPGADPAAGDRTLLLGRSAKLESLGLARPVAPACWRLAPDAEGVLRDLGLRTDIIKTLHRAMTEAGRAPDPTAFALHGESADTPVLGRLITRGLHDELTGEAYAVVEGVDGRVHHLRFADLELTSDARPGAIVELRAWRSDRGAARRTLAVRSDLSLDEQVRAGGATWLDRQLVAKDKAALAGPFGAEVREALDARVDHLVDEGLVRRADGRVVFARNLVATLRARELDAAASAIAARTGLEHRPAAPGEAVSGVYSERVTLAAGRLAMIDDGLGFQLVPWRPALEAHLGRSVSGVMREGGGIEWTLGRARGISI